MLLSDSEHHSRFWEQRPASATMEVLGVDHVLRPLARDFRVREVETRRNAENLKLSRVMFCEVEVCEHFLVE